MQTFTYKSLQNIHRTIRMERVGCISSNCARAVTFRKTKRAALGRQRAQTTASEHVSCFGFRDDVNQERSVGTFVERAA